jgi:hypothetical protein
MRDTLLRIRGIIGSLKPLTLIILILAGVLLVKAISDFVIVLRSPVDPHAARISEIVEGQTATKAYVSISGYAYYDMGYTEEEDGSTVATFYWLVDETTGHIAVVKADTRTTHDRTSRNATVTGMTARTPSDLKAVIRKDIGDLREEGFEIGTDVYVREGAKPPDLLITLLLLSLGGVVTAICLILLLFPTIVFVPGPVPVVAGPVQGNEGVRASGRFLHLKQVRPSIVVGKRTRRFDKAVANIGRLGNNRVMIYIHHVLRSYVYGVRVGTQESDWGVFLDQDSVQKIEPGILYGWQNRYAVRIEHIQKKKPQTLVISFEQPWGLSLFVKRLRLSGFPVTLVDGPMVES